METEHTEIHANGEKTDLKALSRKELETFCEELGLHSYRADQLFRWLYQKGARQFSEMTNLSLELRERLDGIARVGNIELEKRQESADGTVKYLFRLNDERLSRIEAVLIPDPAKSKTPKRLTVCVSTQVGCLFGCRFCATGKMGFFRNLTHGEIVDQVGFINRDAEERYGKSVTNVVYMGMGEPLHNYRAVVESAAILTDERATGLSPKRITVSTVGLPKQIRQLADEGPPVRLAISLHAADDEKRNRIMPINRSLNLTALEEAVRYYYDRRMEPVTYECLLFDSMNDSPEDARRLASIAQWVPSKVNIIMYNPVPGVPFDRVGEDRLNRFMKSLVKYGVTATVRRSRGDDIDAGCGQLAVQQEIGKGKSIGDAQL